MPIFGFLTPFFCKQLEEISMKSPPTLRLVEEIQTMPATGPWKTKSGGELMVTMKLPLSTVQDQYLAYNEAELRRIPEDIRGLRIYTVRNLPKGEIGGTEWHRVREEMIFILEGSVTWECEDLAGECITYTLTKDEGIWMPPSILHTYTVLEENTGLLVFANTLFVPENPATHDTYSLQEFREAQESF